ncbi:MAG: hypothetical protein IJ722_01885 [Alloprevotella sp.]|nr:hypothetical protein [Alloprevotella sp.]
MKTYKYNIGGQELAIRFDKRNERVTEITVDGKCPAVTDEDMPRYAAVISLALLEHDTAVLHDDEPDVITVGNQTSRWANPAESMNERGSLLKNLLGW